MCKLQHYPHLPDLKSKIWECRGHKKKYDGAVSRHIKIRSFRIALTSGKLDQISVLNAKGTILKKINISFIVLLLQSWYFLNISYISHLKQKFTSKYELIPVHTTYATKKNACSYNNYVIKDTAITITQAWPDCQTFLSFCYCTTETTKQTEHFIGWTLWL